MRLKSEDDGLEQLRWGQKPPLGAGVGLGPLGAN